MSFLSELSVEAACQNCQRFCVNARISILSSRTINYYCDRFGIFIIGTFKNQNQTPSTALTRAEGGKTLFKMLLACLPLKMNPFIELCVAVGFFICFFFSFLSLYVCVCVTLTAGDYHDF